MRNELNHIETIERYLSGHMSNGERRAFETLIEGDPKLKAEVDLQAKLVQRLQLMAFKEEMAGMHAQLAASSGVSWWRVVLNSLLAIAGFCMTAVITALILTSLEDKPLTEPISEMETIVAPVQTELTLSHETDSLTQAVQAGSQEDAYASDPHRPNQDRANGFNGNSIDRTEKGKLEIIDTTNKIVENDVVTELEIKTLHEGFIKQFSTGLIDARRGGMVETADSKSRINIPADVLVHKNGLQVIGTVQIQYREYRNPAEMVLSDIPMTYSENGIDYNFNSAGMIEVRAYQNGEELAIREGGGFTIDYNVTEQLDSCFFFALDDSGRTWTKLQEISVQELSETVVESDTGNGAVRGQIFTSLDPRRVYDYDLELIPDAKDGAKQTVTTSTLKTRENQAFYTEFIFNDVVPGSYSLRYDTRSRVRDDKGDQEKGTIANVVIYPGQTIGMHLDLLSPRGGHPIMRKLGERRAKKMGETIQPAYTLVTDTMPGLPSSPTGVYIHNTISDSLNNLTNSTRISPKLVQGLQCRSFGVYNCDQVKRVKPDVKVKATFVDLNGKPLTNGYNLSMINLAYNASFGFEPNEFAFESGAETILLLFTTDDKVYALPASEFSAMGIQKNGAYTFVMTDITNRVKTSAQLKDYLGL
jgi:hypothetical protein